MSSLVSSVLRPQRAMSQPPLFAASLPQWGQMLVLMLYMSICCCHAEASIAAARESDRAEPAVSTAAAPPPVVPRSTEKEQSTEASRQVADSSELKPCMGFTSPLTPDSRNLWGARSCARVDRGTPGASSSIQRDAFTPPSAEARTTRASGSMLKIMFCVRQSRSRSMRIGAAPLISPAC